MKKDDFAKKIKKTLNLSSQPIARDVVTKFFEVMYEVLKSGETILIRNVGKLYVIERPPKKFRNPKTGETIEVPARKFLRFKPSDNIKKAVNE